MQAKIILATTLIALLPAPGFPVDTGQATHNLLPVLLSRNGRNNHVRTPADDREITFNLTYDASSIGKIFTSPEEVMEDVPGFWENENAYRLLKSWHRYNNIPIDYDAWKRRIEIIASIPIDERQDDPGYSLANEVMGARENFIQKAIPHICSFLPKKGLEIESTAYLVAYTHSRGIGVGNRIAIDIFNPYYRGSLSMILNSMVHELYHVGFGHVQFGRTDPEFENTAVMRMLSDFQNEGITTYVAYKAQAFYPAPHEKDYSMLENKETVFKLLKRLNGLFKEAESMPMDQLQQESWELGVENRAYYVVGAHMAQTIDDKRGRDALNETILKGPITFIRTYNATVDKDTQIFEMEAPDDFSIFERLRQAAVNEDYGGYGEILAELRGRESGVDRSKEEKFLRIGLVFMQRKRSDLAVDILEFNAELFPESAAAYNYLGQAYLQKGNNERALENFQKSVELDPEYVDAVENLKKLQE
jgi:tetratricopeptide (TPR) repeat protein